MLSNAPLHMVDNNGNPLQAILYDVMYVPGLSRHLFSVTNFAKYGHYATICNGHTTLYFGPQASPVALGNNNSCCTASDVTLTTPVNKAHLVPCSHHQDHSANKHRISLELLNQHLRHWKWHVLLAASEHGVWGDTAICMGPQSECIHCDISTIRASSRNK